MRIKLTVGLLRQMVREELQRRAGMLSEALDVPESRKEFFKANAQEFRRIMNDMDDGFKSILGKYGPFAGPQVMTSSDDDSESDWGHFSGKEKHADPAAVKQAAQLKDKASQKITDDMVNAVGEALYNIIVKAVKKSVDHSEKSEEQPRAEVN